MHFAVACQGHKYDEFSRGAAWVIAIAIRARRIFPCQHPQVSDLRLRPRGCDSEERVSSRLFKAVQGRTFKKNHILLPLTGPSASVTRSITTHVRGVRHAVILSHQLCHIHSRDWAR